MNNYSNCTIIIPTYNESENIGELLQFILKNYPEISIIVSDDNSTDGTQDIVRSTNNVFLLDRKNERVKGLTASIIDAVLLVKTKYFIVIDGDFQHPPEKIKEFCETLSDCDIVIGTRQKVANEWSIFRRLMSWTANQLAIIRLSLHSIKTKDPMSGFLGAETSLVQQIIRSHQKIFVGQGYKFLFDLLKLAPKKTKICEVQYIFGARQRGSSKISWKHTMYFLKSLIK